MAEPTKYSRDYGFANFQASQPNKPLPGTEVDVELDNVSRSIEETIEALQDIRRSDGTLKNGIVTIDSLAPELTLDGLQDIIDRAISVGLLYFGSDADMAAIPVPASAKRVIRYPLTQSPNQVAPVNEESIWYEWGGGATSDPFWVDANGRVFVQRGYRQQDFLSTLQTAIAAIGTTGLRSFADRAAVVAWIAANPAPPVGTVLRWGGIGVRYIGSGTAIADMAGYVPDGDPSPSHWGAVADWNAGTQTGTDNATAFNACAAWMLSSGRRGRGEVLPGTYRLASTWSIQGAGIWFEGQSGEKSVVLVGDHNTGPVVRVWDRYSGIVGFEIAASTARSAGAAREGLRIESQDTAGFRPEQVFVRDVQVYGQPGDGVLCIGGAWRSEFSNMRVYQNKGHGFAFDNGETYSRVNVQNPGQVNMRNIEAWDNVGHALVIGSDTSVSNRGFRFNVINFDAYRNAATAGVRRTLHQVWAFCDTSTFENCAWDGHDLAGAVRTTGSMVIFGRSVSVNNNRFLNVLNECVRAGQHLSYQTEGISVNNPWIFGTPPALVVTEDSDVRNTTLTLGTESNILSPMATLNSVNRTKRPRVRSKVSNQIVNNSTTLVDDAALRFPMSGTERVQFRFTVFYRGPAAGDIKFAVSVPSGASVTYGTPNSVKVDAAGALAVQPITFTAGTEITFGTLGTGGTEALCAEIVGEVLTAGTAGEVILRWAQATATVGDTTVLSRSHCYAMRF